MWISYIILELEIEDLNFLAFFSGLSDNNMKHVNSREISNINNIKNIFLKVFQIFFLLKLIFYLKKNGFYETKNLKYNFIYNIILPKITNVHTFPQRFTNVWYNMIFFMLKNSVSKQILQVIQHIAIFIFKSN